MKTNIDYRKSNSPKEIIIKTLRLYDAIIGTYNLNWPIGVTISKMFYESKLDSYQIAYGITKIIYEQIESYSSKQTEEMCDILRIEDTDLDSWSQIDMKNDIKYHVYDFLSLKWSAEEFLVSRFFKYVISEKIKDSRFNKYKNVEEHWENVVIREKIIKLAFNYKP